MESSGTNATKGATGAAGADSPPTLTANSDAPSKAIVTGIGIGTCLFFGLLLWLLIALWPTKVPDGGPSPAPVPSSTATAKDEAASTKASASKPKSGLRVVRRTTPAIAKPASPVPSPAPTSSTAPTALAAVGQNAGVWDKQVYLFASPLTINKKPLLIDAEIRFILLVAIAAALGSLIQIAISFTTFLGNGTFKARWTWWYYLRIPVGAGLAVLFYFALRAGFFTSVSGQDVNPFGVAALGGLVGMFSKKASLKLQDVFDELFKSSGDDALKDKLDATSAQSATAASAPPPAVTASDPPALLAGAQEVTLIGSGFAEGAVVSVNGTQRTAHVVDAQHLDVTLDSSDVRSGVQLTVIVTDAQNAASAPYLITIP